MSLFDRRTVLISLAALAGCGFEPVYKKGTSGASLRSQIAMFQPQTRDEYELVARLEERLGRNPGAPYLLDVTLRTDSEALAISRSNDIERYNLSGQATYRITDPDAETTILRGEVNTFTAYSASQQPVATLAAQRDAERRLMVALADKITSEIVLSARSL